MAGGVFPGVKNEWLLPGQSLWMALGSLMSGRWCVCRKLGLIPGSESHTWSGRIPPQLHANCGGGTFVHLSAFFLHLLTFFFF